MITITRETPEECLTMAEINIEKMAQNVAQRAIQELRDNGVFVSRWIPVSEGMPEKEGQYLVTVKKGYIRLGLWIGIKDDWKNVTAWIPLPEPYKEVQDGNINS